MDLSFLLAELKNKIRHELFDSQFGELWIKHAKEIQQRKETILPLDFEEENSYNQGLYVRHGSSFYKKKYDTHYTDIEIDSNWETKNQDVFKRNQVTNNDLLRDKPISNNKFLEELYKKKREHSDMSKIKFLLNNDNSLDKKLNPYQHKVIHVQEGYKDDDKIPIKTLNQLYQDRLVEIQADDKKYLKQYSAKNNIH